MFHELFLKQRQQEEEEEEWSIRLTVLSLRLDQKIDEEMFDLPKRKYEISFVF